MNDFMELCKILAMMLGASLLLGIGIAVIVAPIIWLASVLF